jgi:hypothetical protein
MINIITPRCNDLSTQFTHSSVLYETKGVSDETFAIATLHERDVPVGDPVFTERTNDFAPSVTNTFRGSKGIVIDDFVGLFRESVISLCPPTFTFGVALVTITMRRRGPRTFVYAT